MAASLRGAMPYITAADLQDAMGVQTMLAMFDDDDSATVNTNAVTTVLMRAHARVTGMLVGIYGAGNLPVDVLPDGTQNPLVPWEFKDVEIEQAMIFAYDRRPGLVRAQGDLTAKDREARIQALYEAIRSSAIQATDNAPATEQQNIGGIVVDMCQPVAIGWNRFSGPNRGDF